MPLTSRLPALLLLLPLVLGGAAPAAAQPRPATPACATPPGPLQAAICADAELRRLDARRRALEERLAAGTPRPATIAHRARAWQAELEAETAPEREALREALRDALADRIATLEEALRQDDAIRRAARPPAQEGRPAPAAGAPIPRPATLERSCFGAALNGCRVTGAGVAVSEDGRTRILWQAQAGWTEEDGVRAGIVLFAEVRGGWRPLGWSFEGNSYAPPRLIEHDEGLLLHVAGLVGAMGRGNGDLLFRRGPGGWQEVEMESWWATLPARLPPGFEVRQAVAYDLSEMIATARLWRAEDAECCAGGGNALLEFEIADRRLVLAGVGLNAVARAAQPRAAACPAERATYRLDAAAEWTAELRREGPPASDASDLLLRVRSGTSGAAYWFRFAAAQGYGGLTLWPVAAPGPDVAADGVRDLEVEDGFRLDIYPVGAEMAVGETPPASGTPAPQRLFLPALGRLLAYEGLPQQAAPGAVREARLPPGFWLLSACR